jgi:hypothetical protein
MTPTLATSCAALPPEGAVPPAVWQSQFRGRCLHGRRGERIPALPAAYGSLAPKRFTFFMTTFQDSPWHA